MNQWMCENTFAVDEELCGGDTENESNEEDLLEFEEEQESLQEEVQEEEEFEQT